MIFSFPAQAASDECPAVPRSVTIEADSLAEATKKLAKMLKAETKEK
jgi:hypothetical protein